MVVVDEEWSENLKRQNRCPTFASKLRQCWDGAVIRHTTTKTSMTVENPRLGFHAHITPSEWSEYVKPRDAKGGSFNRLLPVMVEGSKVLPYNHVEKYPAIDGLAEAYDWSRRTPRRVTLTRDAGRRFDELRVTFLHKMADMPPHLRCYVERTPEQILRVAAVLTVSECKTTISRKAIDAAWAFVQYSMRSVEKLVREDSKMSGRTIKTLPELIREVLTRNDGKVTSSTLLRSLGPRADAASLKLTVAEMEDVECVRGATASGRGRPSTIFQFKPAESEGETTPIPSKPTPVVVPSPVPVPAPELAVSGSWL
ncbi:DUF3987 domain-containing protein [Streptomyces niveus]|uniref:DUF3987 domain-containing protein n=1 Tax=Streptomyces niveus TaxID=193462 RepID=UPI0034022765